MRWLKCFRLPRCTDRHWLKCLVGYRDAPICTGRHWMKYVVGYRDAQVGWVEVGEDAAARNKRTTTQLRHALFLVVYAPRRGLLEVS